MLQDLVKLAIGFDFRQEIVDLGMQLGIVRIHRKGIFRV